MSTGICADAVSRRRPRGQSQFSRPITLRYGRPVWLGTHWYSEVLGAVERSSIPLPGRVLTIGLQFGDTAVHLAGEFPDQGIVSPLTLGGTYLALQVETEDVDGAFTKAFGDG